MNKIKKISPIILFLFSFGLFAQDENTEFDFNQDAYFLILHSSKSYEASLNVAKEASKKLDIDFDLRGYMYNNKTNQLEATEQCGCGETHDYFGRGREQENNFISIEESSFYREFQPDYFIVVAAHNFDRKQINKTLKTVQNHYPDAYIKKAKVYLGCTH